MPQISMVLLVFPNCCVQHTIATMPSTFVRYLDQDDLRSMCGLEGGKSG